MARLKGVLLDIDGTLLDSNDAHARAWVEVLAEYGHTIAFDDVRRLIGMGGDKVLPKLTGIDDESDLGARIAKQRRELFLTKYLPTLGPCPGARELLTALNERGLSLIVATSAGKDEVKPLLKQAQVEDLIDAKTSSGDAEESKPDPDIIEAAIKRSGHTASELLMLGDTPYDVTAARRAGVNSVAVRSGGWGDADLAGALAVYQDTADILSHLDESPFARS
jgi:HAD superfamily hydrolase (TIGR01509 family)